MINAPAHPDPASMSRAAVRAELATIFARGIVGSIVRAAIGAASAPTVHRKKESDSAANHLEVGAPTMAPCPRSTKPRLETRQ